MIIAVVKWIDAETIGDSGWQDLEEMNEKSTAEPPIMQTVGFVMGDYSTHITITDSLGELECGHVTKIPVEMIKSIQKFNVE
jgi:hypothetical protein